MQTVLKFILLIIEQYTKIIDNKFVMTVAP